jgi:hypothetical protein
VREAPNRTRIKPLISTKSFAQKNNIVHSYRTLFSFLSVSYSPFFKALSCHECQSKCSPKPPFPRRSSHPLSTHKQRTLIQEEEVASTLRVTHPAMQPALQISETAARYAYRSLPPPRSNMRPAQQHAQPQTGQQISGAGYKAVGTWYIRVVIREPHCSILQEPIWSRRLLLIRFRTILLLMKLRVLAVRLPLFPLKYLANSME